MLIVAGCGVSASEVRDGEHRAAFELALKQATSDFERGVLGDGSISREEYEEANQRWLRCMQEVFPVDGELKVELRTNEYGLYNYGITFPPGTNEAVLLDSSGENTFETAMDACAVGSTDIIGALYHELTVGVGEGSSYEDRAVACLRERGVVEDDYATDNFAADGAAAAERTNPGINLDDLGNPVWDTSKETGLDWGAPQIQECVELAGNPSQ